MRRLYAIDEESGEIAPNEQENIPGLKALRDADLMVIATRFRNLPDEQMKEIDDYLRKWPASHWHADCNACL